MLRYLIAVTEGLLAASIVIGLLWAYLFLSRGQRGRNAAAIGAGTGIVCAAVMAYMKNATSRIDTGGWNLRIFTLSLLAFAAFLILDLRPVREKTGARGNLAACIAAGALAFTYTFYVLPDIMAYPFTFSLNGESVFSTAFLYRLIGWLFGLILTGTACAAVEQSALRLESGTAGVLLKLVLLINGVQQAAKVVQILLTRRMIPSNHTLFQFARYTANYSRWFIYLSMLAAAVIPVALWRKSFRTDEPYENPAQHRKIRAARRNTRRWASLTAACFLMGTLNLTVVSAIQNRPVELSPAEECEIRGDAVYVPLEQVDDGHLHRFAYATPNGKNVRFIIIKKPNSSAYGIGLDACEICGETGYFERGGQVVCKLCDVVMNINTIGFKGGCNPIPIDYSVEGGYIIVPVSTLVEHEKIFK